MHILLFGKNGQVARSVCEAAGSLELTVLGSGECDLSASGAGADAVRRLGPDIVVNATGYTAVDRAEAEQKAATRLNAQAPAELAAAARAVGARFIHLSTDYVFNGAAQAPYNENEETSPVNVYGQTKREGEVAVLAAARDAVIIRTSWVFSEYGANFVKTMLRLGGAHEEVCVVADQIGGPTSAGDIARAIVTIAAKIHRGAGGGGIYHYQGAPASSWADFAEEIFSLARSETAVRRIATSEFPTPARRPLHSVLDCARIERDFGIAQPDWRAGLREVVRKLENAPR